MDKKVKRYLLKNKDVKRLWKATGKKDIWACTAAVMFNIPWFECTDRYNGEYQPDGKKIRMFVKTILSSTVFSGSDFRDIPTTLDDWNEVREIVCKLRQEHGVVWG